MKHPIGTVLKKKRGELTADERRSCGTVCGLLGIALNALLFAGKIAAGTLSGSVAVTADAFNNLSDAGSSVVSMAGFRLAAQKADGSHPFGHGRMEYVAGLIVSMLIILMGFELMQSGFDRIAHPEEISFSALTVWILIGSIAVKAFMFMYNSVLGRRIESASMTAAATDSLSDCAATAAVLVSSVVSHLTGADIDGWCGAAVGLFIVYAGVRAAYDTVSPLLGQRPSAEFVGRVREIVTSCAGIDGVHDIVVHNYGPECVMVTLHAEVAADGDLLALHESIDAAERELERELGCDATIHMDPVVNDAETKRLRIMALAAVKRIDRRFTIHDFRTVECDGKTKVVFDTLIPFGLKKSAKEITAQLTGAVEKATGCAAEIKAEQGYV